MKKLLTVLFITAGYCIISFNCLAQEDRFQVLEQRLRNLSQNVPGLNEKVETSVSNGSLQEFLHGLASTHDLNLNIDPAISQKITSYFTNERVITVLLYVAKEYNLDFNFTGSIISVFPYRDPMANQPPAPKDLSIFFDPATQLITMDLRDDSLLSVAKKITRLSNKNVVVVPELLSKKVTGYIQALPIQNALEKLAITNAFKFDKTNDDVFVLEPLKTDEQIVPRQNPSANNDFTIKKIYQNNTSPGSSSINVTEGYNGKKLVTLNIANAPLKDVLRNISEQAGINYFVYSDIMGTVTANVQNMEFEKMLGFIFQGTKYTFAVNNGVFIIGDRQDEGLRSHQLVQLKYRSVDSLLNVIPAELRLGVEIREFKELNSFLLSGSEPRIKELESFIKQLDKTVPMVLIEVILMDVNKSRTIETGIKAGVSDSVKTGGTIIGSGGLDFTLGSKDINRFIDQLGINNVFNIGRVSPSFYVSLQALENRTNIDLRQTPKLSTLNGHSATLSIGNTRYYQVSTQNVLGSLNPQTVVTQQFYPIEANLSIAIKPFVSGDEQITLNIDVSISDFTANTTINVPPPTATSKFQSIIRVKNEEMVVLGGIERNEKSSTSSGIPLLSRIPVLKWFFSSRSKTDSKTVSVVFIKPTIIY